MTDKITFAGKREDFSATPSADIDFLMEFRDANTVLAAPTDPLDPIDLTGVTITFKLDINGTVTSHVATIPDVLLGDARIYVAKSALVDANLVKLTPAANVCYEVIVEKGGETDRALFGNIRIVP
jgi:hypothetical protein